MSEEAERFEPTLRQHIHLLGGLRCRREADGWHLGPWRRGETPFFVGPIPLDELTSAFAHFNVRTVGHDEHLCFEPLLTQRVWHPSRGYGDDGWDPEKTWQAIAQHAREKDAHVYADLCQFLAVSLHAVGIRLRDVSDEYGRQLASALRLGRDIGDRWSNLALIELQLAIHSLLLELVCTRDYLARIVGFQIEAPSDKDSLPRLFDWVERKSGRHFSDPAFQALARPWADGSDDRWLYELNEYRNQFTHKRPISFSRSPRMFTLAEHLCCDGPLGCLHISLDYASADTAGDALTYLLSVTNRTYSLANSISRMAHFAPKLQTLGGKDMLSIEKIEIDQYES